MSSSHSKDEPFENPFEPPTARLLEESCDGVPDSTNQLDGTLQVPRVQRSYWTGIAVLGAIGIAFYCGALIPDYYSMPPIIERLFGGLLAVCGSLSSLLPIALIRLALHRMYISRAIASGRYPGNQQFDIMYLIYSLILCWVSLLGGFVVFFGICTAVFFMGGTPLRQLTTAELTILGVDVLISISLVGFLIHLGIPKYR
ncbi:MAG: hypothetical protein KGS49_14950 [Planctomycetes bacterium]|nr:hypothetical protein [Planctomycetota bacterium]